MQTKPAGWPADAAVEVVPDVVADFGANSPGAVSVADWSIERQLTGSLLPGQVRAGSGFSVASGSVAFPQTTPPLSPWGKGAQRFVPGNTCAVYATHDGMNRLALGGFLSEKVTGAVSDPAVHVELVEDQARLRRRVSVPGLADIAGTVGVDAVWLIDQIGRSGGYYATPKPAPSTVGSLPLQGSTTAERGTGFVTGSPIAGWQSINGTVHPVLAGGSVGVNLMMGLPLGVPEFLTANVIGTVTFTIGLVNVTVNATAKTIKVGTGAAVTYTGSGNRVQIEAYANANAAVTTFTSIMARARTSHTGAWSAWSTQAVNIPIGNDSEFNRVSFTSGGGTVSGLQVSVHPEPELWAEPNAYYDTSGITLDMPVVPADADGWDVIQQVASATLGAAWVSETGVLTYRNKDWLRGVGTPSEIIVSETSLEDVAWSIGGDDTADRVTVTYQPPDIRTVNDYSLAVWEATEAVEVPAGGTVTVNADVDGTVKNVADWLPIWDSATEATFRRSRWAAATSRDGGGTQPADTALQITTEVVGTSRIRIRITNTTGTRLWTVDGNGQPTLIVRANLSARAGESVSLSMGASEEAAVKPLGVDLGAWVQRYDDAQKIMEWVWSQVQEPRAIIEGVRVKPNLARQLGDIVRITDETTALSSKALVSGIHLSGSHGQYAQTVDLILLDVTFYDLSNHLAGKTFAQLSADWAGLTFAQVSDLINSIGA